MLSVLVVYLGRLTLADYETSALALIIDRRDDVTATVWRGGFQSTGTNAQTLELRPQEPRESGFTYT
jgi:hypothetical protein